MDFAVFAESGNGSEYYNLVLQIPYTILQTKFVVFVEFQYKLSEYVVEFVVKHWVPITLHRGATVICSKILDFHGFCCFR